MKGERERVIITGADTPTGLGTARALAGLDVDLVGLCLNPYSSCCKSRVWSQLVTVENDPEAYLQMLIYQGDGFKKKSVLIPTQDSLVQLISINREILMEYYEFVLPDKSVVDLLLDKTAFHEWAISNGAPVPESHVASSRDELDSILSDIQYPVVIKPLFRTKEWEMKSPSHKVYKLNGREEIHKIGFELFDAAPRYLVQRWIPGEDSDVHFCLVYYDRESREAAYYTGKKILQWQVATGNTAICVGTMNEEVHRITANIFQSLSFKGLGSIEYKQSTEDSRYYITEPTVGRNNLQSYVSVCGGINLSRAAFFDAVSLNHDFYMSKRQKAIWIEEYNTLMAARYLSKRKQFRYKHLKDELKDQGKVSFAYLNMKDPMPFLDLVKVLAVSAMKKTFRKKT